MADQDRVEGAAKNLGGKIKEAAGKVTGDEKLKREGQADQVTRQGAERRRRDQGQASREERRPDRH